jgi:NAD(P)-dependent dehydrogenase (short-subunit alcohol dehydrogenase family)
MKHWTADDIPDQTGKTAIITGGNSGIGFGAAIELARKGCRVILACRNQSKADDAKSRIMGEIPQAAVDVGLLDLSSLQSIREFAQRTLENGKPIDLLINNAGVLAPPQRQETREGFELQLGTNHLGHFALTGLLLPLVQAAKAGRVVTVSSIAHLSARINFDDLQAQKSYDPWTGYRQSKLANLLFGLELERRLRKTQSSTISVIVHPGLSNTTLFTSAPGVKPGIKAALVQMVLVVMGQSSQRGALPTLFGATSPQAQGGHYYGPDGWKEMRGNPAEAKISDAAKDETTARRLSEISQELTGVTYQI